MVLSVTNKLIHSETWKNMICQSTLGGNTRRTIHHASLPYVLAPKSMPKMSIKQTGQHISFVTSCNCHTLVLDDGFSYFDNTKYLAVQLSYP